MMHRTMTALLALPLTVLLSGCGEETYPSHVSTERYDDAVADLKLLATLYDTYQEEKGESPGEMEDFKQLENFDKLIEDATESWRRLMDGSYDVIWRADPHQVPRNPARVRLAWQGEPYEVGGRWVLCWDREVRKMGLAAFPNMTSAKQVEP